MLKDWFKYIEKRLKLLHYRDANDFEQKMKKLYIIWLGYTEVKLKNDKLHYPRASNWKVKTE